MPVSVDHAQSARKSLLQHLAIMTAGVIVVHIVIALRSNKIDVTSTSLLVVVALYYAWYNIKSKEILCRVRFARLVAHLIGFVVVNLSYHLHAFVLFITDSPAIRGSDGFAIDPGWFGPLFGMTTFWAIGLLIHATASVANRGYEDLPRS